MAKRLGTVAPREQVGARTGALYEFQYGEAALACLELLADGADACVYCEWHDDFVIERGRNEPTYEFFQVKSRSPRLGPWPTSEILGVVGKRPRATSNEGATTESSRSKKMNSAKPKPLKPTADVGIAERLLEHQRNFPGACAAFAMVSTHDTTDDAFLALLNEAAVLQRQDGATPSLLSAQARAIFTELVSAYQMRDSTISDEDVWELIARLRLVRARGRPDEVDVVIGLIGQRIYDLSEVDLHTSEQRRVARDLIARVRAKSQHVLPAQPLPTEDEVRSSKAIEIDEVLSLLALSPSGYRELRKGGNAQVRDYSRLHRLCKASGMDTQMIEAACRLHVHWLEWLSEHRDDLTDDLLFVVRSSAKDVLQQIRSAPSTSSWQDIHTAAEAASASLQSTPSLPPVDSKTVLGLVFAMASEELHG